jgi:hypothetical protein
MMRWGMPPPPRAGGLPITNIRNTSSPHWRGWLKPENRCLVPANSFAEYAPEPNPQAKKKDVVSPLRRGRLACDRNSASLRPVFGAARLTHRGDTRRGQNVGRVGLVDFFPPLRNAPPHPPRAPPNTRPARPLGDVAIGRSAGARSTSTDGDGAAASIWCRTRCSGIGTRITSFKVKKLK